MEKVVFVGAGPGAPDLLTIRAKQVIDHADVVIYAGSLVNPDVLSGCKKGAVIYNSASMTLNEVIRVMEEAAKADKLVARVHTGDPSLYGAEREQMRELDRLGIPYEVVPGVSSFLAAAADIKREYTLPGVSQSLIITRMEGRTAVPENESIESLASHQASMVVFLSISAIDTLCNRLISGGYASDTPAAVVYKASWDDEKIIRGTLGDIAQKVREAGISRTALVLVGRFLGDDFENSKLYDENFSHGYRKAKTYHAKRIMVQGTMSGAGKSFVTAALCRIFRQDGYSVAPFKSQNMALNSSVTKDGLEIGRAQAMQAEAAGVEASADMNPILLKPTGDEQSQVIIRGEVAGNMSASEYYEKKADLIPIIEKAFDTLAKEYDIVVIEGAGSPAEINLKENDIVNMGMAEIADAPVILVADIDPGGVFAQIVGTVELMEPWERARVKGIIINKFRGDVSLLEPGIKPLEKRLGIPVIGIIPMEEIDLDDEDSLAPRLKEKRSAVQGNGLVIAVVRLPHISNFTDFSVLERWDGVSLIYTAEKNDIARADLIVIPGTKNTMADLAWLKDTGIADVIIQKANIDKTPVTGICGGYQMLGETLSDPEGVEGVKGAAAEGLGLLPVNTYFAGKKTRARSSGTVTDEAAEAFTPGLIQHGTTGHKGSPNVLENDTSVNNDTLVNSGDSKNFTDCRHIEGYEIHMGTTVITDEGRDSAFPFMTLADGRNDGCVRADGLCMGTYMHGLFDNTLWTGSLLLRLAKAKGTAGIGPVEDVTEYRKAQYDKLADLVRCSLDMDAIYRILDGSVCDAGDGL